VSGLDRDGPAVEDARANAERNGVEAEFEHADVEQAALPIRELLLANAPPPVQRRLAAEITPAVRQVIVSGIVEGELEEVRIAYAAAGFKPVKGMAADSWVAVLLERDGG
jgi:ribosomal protein L11 methylase PrmA